MRIFSASAVASVWMRAAFLSRALVLGLALVDWMLIESSDSVMKVCCLARDFGLAQLLLLHRRLSWRV
jgi:hypothetical protein